MIPKKVVIKLKVMMRLYRQHDLDLIYLYKLKGFSFQEAVKKSIRMAINNSSEKIEYPVPDHPINEMQLPKAVQFHIYLSPQTEADIIKWIQSITKGYRNCVLKNVVRNHLSKIAFEPYNINTDIIFKTGKTPKIDFNDMSLYIKKDQTHTEENAEVLIKKILNAPLSRGTNTFKSEIGDKLLSNDKKGEL